MTDSIDIGALQAQLELNRSSLADSIFSKLPSLESDSKPTKHAQSATLVVRSPLLGVGATHSNKKGVIDVRGNSIEDLRLKGKLTAKRKRDDFGTASSHPPNDTDQEEEDGRSSAVGSRKKKSQAAGSNGKSKSKDPFSSKGVEVQRALQTQNSIVVVDGKEIDTSTLSKTQRKKLNKRVKTMQVDDNLQEKKEDKEDSATCSLQPLQLTTESTPQLASVTQTSAATLTPLQAQMLSKLAGSRFRTINEKLYTTDSKDALEMITQSPAVFDEYHQGFREQVKTWPKNPVDKIAEMFDATIVTNVPANKAKGKKKAKNNASSTILSQFTSSKKARFSPSPLVVDMGCGEAGLAKKLVSKGVKVLSYDLVDSSDGWIRRQDTAQIGGLPLPGFYNRKDPLSREVTDQDAAPGVVDVVVFCLSLMGTNWAQMILEAKRVLREGGEMIIAEVSSRFDGFDKFEEFIHLLGFGLENRNDSNSHFVLFEFVKLDASNDELVQEQEIQGKTEEELVRMGQQLLKPCLYKRR